MSVDEQLQAMLNDLKLKFGVELPHISRRDPVLSCADVSVHNFITDGDPLPIDQRKEIRRWIEERGWQYSRQLIRNPACNRDDEYIYLARIIELNVDIGYHATRVASLSSIQNTGLLPSIPERQTSERSDCDGNIYICKNLGTPEDTDDRGKGSAYWWRDHLARNNRFYRSELGYSQS